MPKTKCKGKKDAELKILSKKLIPINSTIKASNISPIKRNKVYFLIKQELLPIIPKIIFL